MLYSESRQSGQKGHSALVSACFFLFVLLVGSAACKNKFSENSLQEQRERRYALNSHLLTESLGQIVSADSCHRMVDEQLHRFYADSTFERVWTKHLLPDTQVDTVIQELRYAIRQTGFSEQAFRLNQIKEDFDSTSNLCVDSIEPRHIARLARLEYSLSRAYLYYVVGQTYGFMERPEHIFNRTDARDKTDDGRVLSYREIMHQMIEKPDTALVAMAVGKVHSGNAVSFMHSCKPTSALYGQLEEKLSVTSDESARKKMMANMERLRWKTDNMPSDGEKCVLVNIAAQKLWAMSRDTLFDMRVVCGARKTKTPLMKGMLNWMVVNPEWYIPANIVKTEVSAHGGDSAYFARHRYFITNAKHDTISVGKVSRAQLYANQYRVTQRRGPGNSLGRLKFNFNNPFDVYLHDTNMPGAFNREDRALSHGCVRVQRPFDLACFLIDLKDEHDVDRLRTAIGIKPKTDKEREWLEEHADDTELQLKRFGNRSISPNVPVYILYYTMFVDPTDNKLHTWGDPYGYDAIILKHIKPFM